MRKQYLIIFCLLSVLNVFSQPQDSIPDLIREDKDLDSGFPIMLKDANWNTKLGARIQDSDYELYGFDLDTAQIYPAIRKIVSPIYYDNLNKASWHILTMLTGSGRVVSVAFIFKDDSGVDMNEFAVLSAWIKKKFRWKLEFNKEVEDTIYLSLSIWGPKF